MLVKVIKHLKTDKPTFMLRIHLLKPQNQILMSSLNQILLWSSQNLSNLRKILLRNILIICFPTAKKNSNKWKVKSMQWCKDNKLTKRWQNVNQILKISEKTHKRKVKVNSRDTKELVKLVRKIIKKIRKKIIRHKRYKKWRLINLISH